MAEIRAMCLWWFVLLACGGCGGMKEERGRTVDLPWQDLREGDLLFRRGDGVASRFVLIAGRGVYSHIGILVRDSGRWKVVHAVLGEPDFENDPDRVKLEPVERFFSRERAVCGAVMRVNCDSSQACRAAAHAKMLAFRRVLFDHSYNHKDTTALYCTELVEFVFNAEGVDLAGKSGNKVHVPGWKGDDFLFPADIAESVKVKCICTF